MSMPKTSQGLQALRNAPARAVLVTKRLVSKTGAEAHVAAKLLARQKDSTAPPGLLSSSILQDAWEPNVLHCWDVYASNAAAGQHHQDMMDFYTDLMEHLDQPMGMAMYEHDPVRGTIGAIAMQGHVKGEGGLDDATGANGGVGGASFVQTERASEDELRARHEERVAERNVKPGASSSFTERLAGSIQSIFGGKEREKK